MNNPVRPADRMPWAPFHYVLEWDEAVHPSVLPNVMDRSHEAVVLSVNETGHLIDRITEYSRFSGNE